MLYLVRHAHAGTRPEFTDDDHLRPLSPKGRKQAAALGQHLGLVTADGAPQGGPIQVLSSFAVRCATTVEPLAQAHGVEVHDDVALWEGEPYDLAIALVNQALAAPIDTVVCTHADVIPAVIEALEDDGVRFPEERRWAKGSTWIIEVEDGRATEGRYLPPPT